MEVLKLLLKRKILQVLLEDEAGNTEKYTLQELLGSERDAYLNKLTSRLKIDKDGRTAGIKTFAGFQTDLLVLSLLGPDGDPVSQEFVEGLPSSTQQELFTWSQKLSALDVAAADVEKNG